MTNTTPAPRPAACDLDAAIMWCADSMAFRRAVGVEVDDSHLEEWEITVRQLVADLAATRAERDAARAALPDARMLNSIAAVLEADGKGYTADILRRWANTIDDAATAPAPVPAAADVPAFLLSRVS